MISSRPRTTLQLRTVLGALALLVLALALRVPHGDLAEWKGDEAIEWAKARAIVREGARPRGLPTTEGPRAPPHPLYVYAAALALDDRPEACRLEVALLWSAAIALLALGPRQLGGRASLGAALVLAVLPDVVRRGRMAWYPNLSGPVAALVLLALVRTVRAPRGRAAGVLLALSALLGLLHYSNVGLAALGVGTSAWALRRGADRRALAAGLAAALVVATPFLAEELGRGFADTRAALSVAAHGGRTGQDLDAPERSPFAFGREALAALDLESYARTLGESGEARVLERGAPHALAVALSGALVGLVLAGAVLGLLELGQAFSRREAPGLAGTALAVVLAAWAPFAILRLPARPHYVQSALPAVAVLAGIALASGARLRGRTTAALAAAFLLAVGVVCVVETRALLSAVDAGHAEPGSEYDLPFRDKRAACELVLEGELELVRYRRFEDVLLLEECFRELERRDPERARRFVRVPFHEPYWELDYSVPRPREPRGHAELVAAQGLSPEKGELGRYGSIVVRRVP